MSNKNVNVQDVFLNDLRKNHTKFTVFLMSGFVYSGCTLLAYDNYSIAITYKDSKDNGILKQAVVYKHAISTYQPYEFVDFGPREDKPKEAATAKK